MRELLELQTGQVAFISGLMSGFALAVAAHVLRYGARSRAARLVFVLFLTSSLLFLVALYVDVRLSIELAGIETLPDNVLEEVAMVRHLGTGSATVAFALFVVATALLGWVATSGVGIITTLIGGAIIYTFWFIWTHINTIAAIVQKI